MLSLLSWIICKAAKKHEILQQETEITDKKFQCGDVGDITTLFQVHKE